MHNAMHAVRVHLVCNCTFNIALLYCSQAVSGCNMGKEGVGIQHLLPAHMSWAPAATPSQAHPSPAGRQLYRINLSEQTDIMDLLGADLPVQGGSPGAFAWWGFMGSLSMSLNAMDAPVRRAYI